MLLTLSTTHQPATDLGYLLMKNPANVHTADLAFGTATLFFPQADETRTTAALTLQIDPIELVRGKARFEDQYVNDRPYAASSFLAVAIGHVLGTAMSGRSRERQAVADQAIPLEAMITPLPARGGAELLERLFAPLGYAVQVTPIPLDPAHPDWGDSPYVTVELSGTVRLAALLTHLFVLIPVLDNQKHYYVGEDEVAKLLRKGEGWLETHPARELIVRRYLRNLGSLVRLANHGLDERVETEAEEEVATRDAAEETLEKPIRLNDQRMERVVALLQEAGGASVLDLGCGEGRLVRALLKRPAFRRIVGLEVAAKVLAAAGDRLRLESLPEIQRQRVELLQGSLVYRDDRLRGFDAAAVVEVIEHMDAERLPAFEAALFGHARPSTVIVTTPNREYNALFDTLAAGAMRHGDHRFEWSRAEFRHWCDSVAHSHGYAARLEGIGVEDANYGCPTQVAVFTRIDADRREVAA